MPAPNNKLPRSRPPRGNSETLAMLKSTLPDPLPKGVSIVYCKQIADYVVRTSTKKAIRGLLTGVWAAPGK